MLKAAARLQAFSAVVGMYSQPTMSQKAPYRLEPSATDRKEFCVCRRIRRSAPAWEYRIARPSSAIDPPAPREFPDVHRRCEIATGVIRILYEEAFSATMVSAGAPKQIEFAEFRGVKSLGGGASERSRPSPGN